MNLRDKLREILPSLLPRHEREAIKGKELIARVREVLGDTYSDGSLRTQFSLLSLEEDTCLARIPNGQGYYLRSDDSPLPSLQEVFTSSGQDADSALHRAIALAVRLYDTAGLSVFAYPVETEESWTHPDLVAVQWPAGRWGSDGAYVMEPAPERKAAYRAVCVGVADSTDGCRQALFRAISCGLWAQESELLLIGSPGDEGAELSRLASLYGVGVCCLAEPDLLHELPHAETIFRATAQEAQELLQSIPRTILAHPRHRHEPLFCTQDTPDVTAVQEWAEQCVARGRVEAYERRVAVN